MGDEREKWGPGDLRDARVIQRLHWGPAPVPGRAREQPAETFEIVHGEHPHSRNYSNLYARDVYGEPVAFDGTRLEPRIEVWEENYLKSSGLSGDEIRRTCQARIYFNGRLVYGFSGRDAAKALRRAADLIVELSEHSGLDVTDPADGFGLLGRKIYYHETPAIVTRYFADQGAVVMKVDGTGHFPEPIWRREDGREPELEDTIKDDIFSDHIWWSRESKATGVACEVCGRDLPQAGLRFCSGLSPCFMKGATP